MEATLWHYYSHAKQSFSQFPGRDHRRSPDEDYVSEYIQCLTSGLMITDLKLTILLIMSMIKMTIFRQSIFIYVISLNHHYEPMRASWICCVDYLGISTEKTQILTLHFPSGMSIYSHPHFPPLLEPQLSGTLGKKKKKKHSRLSL